MSTITLEFYEQSGGVWSWVAHKFYEGTLKFSDALDRRNTLNATVDSLDGSWSPEIGQRIRLTHTASGERQFGGMVFARTRKKQQGASRVTTEITCSSLERITTRRYTGGRSYSGKTIGYIFHDLIDNCLTGDNITGTNVDDGPVIEYFELDYSTVQEAFDKLVELCPGYRWYIDTEGDTHLFQPTDRPAPFSITGVAPVDGTAGALADVVHTESDDLYANRVYVRIGKLTLAPVSETYPGDGSSRTFATVSPIAVEPAISVNGSSQSVGVEGIDTGKQWYWTPGSTRLIQDDSGTILTSGDALTVSYSGQDSRVSAPFQDDAAVTGRADIEGGTGYHEILIDATETTTTADAESLALAYLETHSEQPGTLELTVRQYGLQAGQAVTVSLPSLGLSGEYAVESVVMTDSPELRWRAKLITGALVPDWIRRLGKGGITASGGGSSITSGAGPFIRTLLIKDTTVGDDIADNVAAFNARINQAGTLRRITGTLRKTITADLVVRFNVIYPSGDAHVIGTFTLPATGSPATGLKQAVSFTAFDWEALPDLGIITADITASDGSKDKNGIAAWTIEWVSRGAGQATAEGLAWQGAWDAGTAYALDDLAQYGGSTYISLEAANSGNQPDTSGAWALIAAAGAAGATGATGPAGADGVDGVDGIDAPHGFGASFDGAGSALTAGMTAYVTVPKGGTIAAWNLLVDTGTCTIKVWKVARGTAIPTASDSISTSGVAIASGTALHSTTLTDFTTLAVVDGDLIAVHLEAVSGATQVNFSVELI